MSYRSIPIAFAAALMLTACATTGRPDRPLDPNGEAVRVSVKPGVVAVQGHLLAVNERAIHVLARGRALEIPTDEVSELLVTGYNLRFMHFSGEEREKLAPYTRYGGALKPDQRRELLERYRQPDFLKPPKLPPQPPQFGSGDQP